MTLLRPLSLLLLAALLAGCADDGSGDPTPEGAGVLEPQRQAIERARGVEDDLADAAARQRERIEDDEG